jgi:hypothetical protein
VNGEKDRLVADFTFFATDPDVNFPLEWHFDATDLEQRLTNEITSREHLPRGQSGL